ncbi:predicted protein [Naegleria gruberi]|uniref:Predicted protein n=1 Tax=Naegleria gruberi TaxID=5762 RepID=D2V129_NAEGR|nr:uncharacterized protein NAEGRDRAFT_45841 [Naegleria gruberi]EFC49831.1 predicted protein [Naegleria gruberi]|eukprot:XP_002682575.1 predicted protein [Naegleria gruberi strain NEG-M]
MTQIKEVKPFKFDSNTKKWITVQFDTSHQGLSINDSFKLGSLNIMDEKYKIIRSIIIRDDERFVHTVKLLEEENFNVLALNEVTPRFLKRLQDSEFFSKNYFFTDIVNDDVTDSVNKSLGSGFQGNLILSKVCPIAVHLIENPISKHFVLATFECDSTEKLCMISAHTLAYAKNVEQRKTELKSIANNSYVQEMDQVIILGDLNLHAESEDEIIEEIGFRDVWKETRSDKGYTFDPLINSFIRFKYLGMEKRRMRLDRILIRNSNTLGACQPMKLFANKPIHESSKHLSAEPLNTPLWYTLFNILFGNINRKDYLFYSDHFGMKVQLKRYENQSDLLKQHQAIKEEAINLTENHVNDRYSFVRKALLSIFILSLAYFVFRW